MNVLYPLPPKNALIISVLYIEMKVSFLENSVQSCWMPYLDRFQGYCFAKQSAESPC